MKVKKIYTVKGMHCNSCASLIEKALKNKVESISVSYNKERAEIEFDLNKIHENKIKTIVSKLGYTLESYENSNNKKLLPIVIISLAIILIILYFTLQSLNIKLPDIQLPKFGQNASLGLLFLIGLLTGFHCVSMCGGFVVSYTAKNAIQGHKGFLQHLCYGGSKLLSYTIIGGIFGLIGGIFAFSIGLRGWVAIVAGIFMVLYSLSMFGISFFRRFQFNTKLLTHFANKTSAKATGFYKRPIITGLLNGLFIACGPLQAMYLFAAGSGSFFTGAVSLFVFGLGTLPLMIGFGSLASAISHKTTAKILKLSAVIVLILGLIMINRGLTLVGGPSIDSIIPQTSNSAQQISLENGIQIVNMSVDGSGYTPRSFVIKKDIPVKWNINVKELTNCNEELILRSNNINLNLHEGMNTIQFTPNKLGTLSFSCGMGMLRGSFLVTDTGTASQQEINTATPRASSGCGMGSGCGCGMR